VQVFSPSLVNASRPLEIVRENAKILVASMCERNGTENVAPNDILPQASVPNEQAGSLLNGAEGHGVNKKRRFSEKKRDHVHGFGAI
jgi:hypothetical protein